MKFGSPFSAGFGSPENWLVDLNCEAQNNKIRVEFSPILDGWYGVYRDSKLQTMKFCTAYQDVVLYVPADFDVSRQIVSVVRAGAVNVDVRRAARWYDAQTSKRATLEWTYDYAILGSIWMSHGTTKFSSWNLTGLLWSQVDSVDSSRCRGSLDVVITAIGSIATISIQHAGTSLASGTIAVGGSGVVTLTGVINGSVTVAAGFEYPIQEELYVLWPQEMRVSRDGDIVATVPFVGEVNGSYTETSDLAADTYTYTLQLISDSGAVGDADNVDITIPGPPAPPTGLVYVEGDNTNCTVSFIESITPGVSYNFYVQKWSDDYMNFNDPVEVTENSYGYQLPPLDANSSYKLVVRAVVGTDGIEEQNRDVLNLEFDDGNYVPPRPNYAFMISYKVSAGRTITVHCGYDPARQAGVATKVNLRYKSSWGGTPSAPSSAPLVKDGYVYTASPSIVVPADGWYLIEIAAATAGDVEITGDDWPVYVDSSTPAAVVGDGAPTRG